MFGAVDRVLLSSRQATARCRRQLHCRTRTSRCRSGIASRSLVAIRCPTGDPDHYTLRFIGGDPHYNSTIVSHAFYLAIEGGTNRTSGRPCRASAPPTASRSRRSFFRALTALMPSSSTFALTRVATIQAARDLYGAGSAAERAITQAWDAVGVQERTAPTAAAAARIRRSARRIHVHQLRRHAALGARHHGLGRLEQPAHHAVDVRAMTSIAPATNDRSRGLAPSHLRVLLQLLRPAEHDDPGADRRLRRDLRRPQSRRRRPAARRSPSRRSTMPGRPVTFSHAADDACDDARDDVLDRSRDRLRSVSAAAQRGDAQTARWSDRGYVNISGWFQPSAELFDHRQAGRFCRTVGSRHQLQDRSGSGLRSRRRRPRLAQPCGRRRCLMLLEETTAARVTRRFRIPSSSTAREPSRATPRASRTRDGGAPPGALDGAAAPAMAARARRRTVVVLGRAGSRQRRDRHADLSVRHRDVRAARPPCTARARESDSMPARTSATCLRPHVGVGFGVMYSRAVDPAR